MEIGHAAAEADVPRVSHEGSVDRSGPLAVQFPAFSIGSESIPSEKGLHCVQTQSDYFDDRA